jgi:hypothetical protein
MCRRPMLSKFATHKTVMARFWPWLEPFFQVKVFKIFQVVPSSLGSVLESRRLAPNLQLAISLSVCVVARIL